jgi:dipeptidyl aminopeptidase/acylaminoacyl peptidase
MVRLDRPKRSGIIAPLGMSIIVVIMSSIIITFISMAFLLAVVVLIIGAISLYGSSQLIRRRVPDTPSDPAQYGLTYEEVAFPSRDGLTLRGWFIPAPEARGTVVFCHGHAGSMDPDVKYAPAFHERGYNILMFDFRGHGRSEGQHVSMGYYEREDLLGAIDYLQSRGIDRLGVLGFSMGGAVAMATAPHTEAIRAVVSDGGFARLSDAVTVGVRERGLPGSLASLVGYLILWLMGLRLGCSPNGADPIGWVDKIAPRALLIIQGALDPFVTVEEARELYTAAGEPKDIWIVPGAGHREADRHHPEEYRHRVLAFFDQWLVRQTR